MALWEHKNRLYQVKIEALEGDYVMIRRAHDDFLAILMALNTIEEWIGRVPEIVTARADHIG